MSMSGASFRSRLMNRSNKQVVDGRIDRRDAEAEADGRVGGRAAALAEDVSRAGEADEVPHGEEIRFVVQVADELEFVLELVADFFGDAARVALGGALPGELRRDIRAASGLSGASSVGIFVAQLVEREAAAVGDFDGAGDGVRRGGEDRADFVERPQVPLGVGEQVAFLRRRRRSCRGGSR